MVTTLCGTPQLSVQFTLALFNFRKTGGPLEIHLPDHPLVILIGYLLISFDKQNSFPLRQISTTLSIP